MLKFFVLPLFAYLLGSIPWGIILTRLFTTINIKETGSGNIGATNVGRMAGPTLGILTLVGDVLKGAFPVWLAITITGSNNLWSELYISLIAVMAFMGHLYPVYMKFKDGGKGVATAAGCFAVISPLTLVVVVLVFIMFVCWANRVSVASLAAAAVLPVAMWKTSESTVLTGCAMIISLWIYIRHMDNIKRLLAGTEPAIWK